MKPCAWLVRVASFAWLLAHISAAQTVHEVPRDFATIQAAIDAASAGDVVLVRGGVHDGTITIDRPLTLMGDPRPSIQPPFVTGSLQPPAIRLAGGGAGRVALINLAVGGFANGILNSSSSAGILGGGFDELHLFECAVAGPRWLALTGVAFGSPAVETDVAEILVERCELRGADSASDFPDYCYANGPPGPAGIDAPGANVVVLDSLVRGGGSDSICTEGDGCPIGGAGGPGVLAASLWEGASEVLGGDGAIYFTLGGKQPCGSASDGEPALVLAHQLLGNDLTVATRLRLGKVWRLSWTTPGSSSTLLLGTTPRLTPLHTPSGPLFVDLAGVFLTQSFPAGSASLDLRVPLRMGLIGSEVVAQVLGSAGWTRPLIDVLRPVRAERRDPP